MQVVFEFFFLIGSSLNVQKVLLLYILNRLFAAAYLGLGLSREPSHPTMEHHVRILYLQFNSFCNFPKLGTIGEN